MTHENEAAALHALLLDGRGGARPLEPTDIRHWNGASDVLWLHVDVGRDGASELLREVPGLDARQAMLLASEDTRPHADVADDAVRLVLRGVNLHPEADPEDMVSLRLWAAAGRVASARRRRLLSVEDVLTSLAEGRGPRTAGELLGALAGRLVARASDTVDALDERVAAIEDTIAGKSHSARPDPGRPDPGRPDPAESAAGTPRREIADVRRAAIMLRRYLAPQRDALGQLGTARLSWLGADERLTLRDAMDATVRHVENLDSLRERANVAREELVGQETELTNRRVFLLSLISAIFLPLSFLTGLLGINVGGIPGADDAHGFWIASALLAAVALAIVLAFRFGRWL